MRIFRLAILLIATAVTTPVLAARCGGDFNSFVAGDVCRKPGWAAGMSQAWSAEALGGVDSRT